MHLLIDIANVEVGELTTQRCREFLVEMPDAIAMTRIRGPMVVVTHSSIMGFVVIAESHVSVHVNRATGAAFVDIFSCKAFDEAVALDLTCTFLGGQATSRVLDRGLEYLG